MCERYLNNCPDAAAVKQAQNFAQSSKIGVWNGNYTKPWEYRKTKRNLAEIGVGVKANVHELNQHRAVLNHSLLLIGQMRTLIHDCYLLLH